MRAVHIQQVGGVTSLGVGDHALLPLAAGEVRVRVAFAGINFWDIMQRRGTVPMPADGIPGSEGSGRVIAKAEDVTSLGVGDRVAWSKVRGSYAEEVQAVAEWFAAVPDAIPLDDAAAVLAQGTTAWYLAEQACPLSAGQTGVVFAAAGGVGHLLTQLLGDREVRVIGVVSTEAKREFLIGRGVGDVLVDSAALVEDVRRLAPTGAAGVFDANGGPHALRDLAMLGVRGKVVYYGTANGVLPLLDIGSLAPGSLTVSRVRGQEFLGTAAQWQTAAASVLDLVASSKLVVHIDRTVRMDNAGSQHERMEARANMGKLLLAMSPD